MTEINHPFQFRPIQKEDNPKVKKLIQEVMTEFEAVGEGYSITDSEVNAMFEAYSEPRSQFWVLTKKEKIVGCGGIAQLANGDVETCELRKMYFRPEARGHGMGKKMVNLCFEKAKQLGYKKVYLETIARMSQANILYQRMGFEKTSKMGDTGHSACGAFYVKVVN